MGALSAAGMANRARAGLGNFTPGVKRSSAPNPPNQYNTSAFSRLEPFLIRELGGLAHQGLRRVDWGRGLPLPDRGRMSRESVQEVAGSDVGPVIDSAAARKAEMSGCSIGEQISDSPGRSDDAIRSCHPHRRGQPGASRSGRPRFGSLDGMNGRTEHPRVFETSRASLEIALDMQRGCSALSVGGRAGRGCPPLSASLESPLWASCGAACRIQCCKALGPARRLPAAEGLGCGDHAARRGVRPT